VELHPNTPDSDTSISRIVYLGSYVYRLPFSIHDKVARVRVGIWDNQMGNWTFITNHAAVLAKIASQGQVTEREIATSLGITQWTVHRIISQLICEGYVTKWMEDQSMKFQVNDHLVLRHAGVRGVKVRELLDALVA
jgi:hypothetical protein